MKLRIIVANAVIAACLLSAQLSYAQDSDQDTKPSTDHSMEHSKSHSVDQADMATQQNIQQFKFGDLIISQAHTRVTPPGATVAGGYLTITNNGNSDDILLGGRVDFAEATEVHSMQMKGDVMKMRRLKDGLTLPAGETVELAHGGFHLMFKRLKEPVSISDEKSLTLIFKQAGEYQLPLAVIPLL